LFLEFGHFTVLNFLEKMNIFGNLKTSEEGEYEKELDSGGHELTT
jgi:hypothetical protein